LLVVAAIGICIGGLLNTGVELVDYTYLQELPTVLLQPFCSLFFIELVHFCVRFETVVSGRRIKDSVFPLGKNGDKDGFDSRL
jgi:hypothetical protein